MTGEEFARLADVVDRGSDWGPDHVFEFTLNETTIAVQASDVSAARDAVAIAYDAEKVL